MKYINNVGLAFLMSLSVLLTGCYKDYVSFTPYSSSFESKEAFYNSVSKKDTIFKNNVEKSFIVEHGDLLIQFKDSSFVKKSDYSLVLSDVEISITTFSNAGKMVLNNRPSTSFETTMKENIVAHQYIYLKATSNNEELVFADNKKAIIYLESQEELAPISKIYTFEPYEFTSFNSWEAKNIGSNNLIYTSWLLNDQGNDYSGKGYAFEVNDEWTCLGSYQTELNPNVEKYKSIHVDLEGHYYQDGQKYQLPEAINPENTDVFMLQEDLPITAQVELIDGDWIAHNILKDSKSTIVVISEMGNKLFYAEKDITELEHESRVKLTPLPHEASDIIKKLLNN